MTDGASLAQTCGQIIDEKLPNLFRLFPNPYVVQTCYCLSEYVRTTWPARSTRGRPFQSFLANSFDEALSGAIKLARYCANVDGRPSAGLVFDPSDRLGSFAAVDIGDGKRIEFVPGLSVVDSVATSCDSASGAPANFGFIVLSDSPDLLPAETIDALRTLIRERSPLVVVCVNRRSLAAHRRAAPAILPDIVVFDESFVNFDVPFGAFTARRELFEHWNGRGKSTFHSTTFQPNTTSTLHFMNCLASADPVAYHEMAAELERVRREPDYCLSQLAALYSPFLAKAIRSLGLGTPDMTAAGHYVVAAGRPLFDCVAGVACSVRGHNPESYLDEIGRLDEGADLQATLEAKVAALTGLEHLLPAVSGASAVESAMRLGLVAQYPKTFILAFKGGFAGKTLLALTGTARAAYKQRLDPLYQDVVYVDPFAPDVLTELEAKLSSYPIAVVQLELIQAVGGVRAVPLHVVEYLAANRQKWGYLLFIDEVQTGMYRTGPFTLCQKLGVQPDLLTIGKGTSDMMAPFALTLYSDAVQMCLNSVQSRLPDAIRQRYGYGWGYKTALNVLEQAETLKLPGRAQALGDLFEKLLKDGLGRCRMVRAVRVYGLLIAIELNTGGWMRRRLKKAITGLYLREMLWDPDFPVFVGFCQYEPNVLKLTPPLTITPDEVRQTCSTITKVLRSSPLRLLVSTIRNFLAPPQRARRSYSRPEEVTREPAAC